MTIEPKVNVYTARTWELFRLDPEVCLFSIQFGLKQHIKV